MGHASYRPETIEVIRILRSNWGQRRVLEDQLIQKYGRLSYELGWYVVFRERFLAGEIPPVRDSV
jgi:hypothetical protein